jgi:protein-S-isoprenylcysteine O-methyltransferase Ste14
VTAAALVLFVLYFAVAFGLRTWLQHRRTGDTGWRGISGEVWSVEWTGGVLFAVALVAAVCAPAADLAGLAPIGMLVAEPLQAAGVAVTLAGIALTFAAVSMGTSWRVGVDEAEPTELVTDGAFSIVRNPIFTAMGVTGAGLFLVVPNVVALAGLLGLAVALQLQVRGVEEPYLARQHGHAWSAYSSRVGRFLPGIGTISTAESSDSRTLSGRPRALRGGGVGVSCAHQTAASWRSRSRSSRRSSSSS